MLGSARNALLVLMFILLRAGVLGAACPEGDLHVDCHIDWFDVQILAEQWLDGAGSEADLIGDDGEGTDGGRQPAAAGRDRSPQAALLRRHR